MQYFGFYELVRHGEICRQITVIGKTHTADFVVGEIKEFGKKFLKRLHLDSETDFE